MLIRVAKHEEGGKLVPSILYTKNYYNSGKKHARLMGFLSLPKDVYSKLCKADGSSNSELSAGSSSSKRSDEENELGDLDLYLSRSSPMLVSPNKWNNTFFYGAYLQQKAPLMKVVCSAQIAAVKQARMKELLDSLDYLGSVGWVINRVLLQVIEEAWKENILLGDLPIKYKNDLPEKNDPACYRSKQQIAKEEQEWAEKRQKKNEAKDKKRGVDVDPSSVPPVSAVKVDACSVVAPIEDDHDELVFDDKAYKKLTSQVKQKNAEQLSLRSDFFIKMSIAKRFKDDVIYFPHNLDFRGRAYPVPPNLTHLGSDLCRALLLFSEAKPLGDVGLDWLKVHLSNLFGNNKIGIEQRIEWADSHRDDISDSALNPLNGKRWWATAENPFQALATCIEIRNAVNSGDPTTYRCRLPVHQDGSCNGLQHYAGLGRDELGAAAVNLIDHENPQDVYSRVLENVLQHIEKGVNDKDANALLLNGFVDRKVIKQTVMTSVYGVTRIGARAQIQARLTEKLQVDANAILSERQEYEIYCASNYLAGLTLVALESMFGRAKDIMAWLSECAKLVAKEVGKHIYTYTILYSMVCLPCLYYTV
jgi:DNA-directed RNA polymerase